MVGAMTAEPDFLAVCRALDIEPWQAMPRRSQAWINAEREWREITAASHKIVVERRLLARHSNHIRFLRCFVNRACPTSFSRPSPSSGSRS